MLSTQSVEQELEANLFIEETMKNELEEKELSYLEEMYYLEEKDLEDVIEDHHEQLANEKEYQEQLKQDEISMHFFLNIKNK